MLYAEVVLPIALDRKFHYVIPEPLQDKVVKGSVVIVPFGIRTLTGYCVGLTEKCNIPIHKLKDIKSVIEEIPSINSNILQLTKWIANYYLCSWGEALEATLPVGVRKERKRRLKSSDTILQQPTISNAQTVARRGENVAKQEPFTPTEAQAQAINKIKESVTAKRPDIFLLHGITDSGKTEVYLQVIDEVIKEGRQAIVLVPEISLTPQTVKRFSERFDRIAILHSYLTEKQRAIEWRNISDGKVDVVIGARSAVFAPTRNLGILVIDEEYETSFKQENNPRYHARDVAIKRAEIEKAVVILGSATPSLESYYSAQIGKYYYLELPERIEKRPLPYVGIVDMTHERKGKTSAMLISKQLESAIRQALNDREQVILFLNRRGYLTLITCPRCKLIIRCVNCQIALTYHKNINKMVCHHCNAETEIPTICPECGHNKLAKLGSGTERIEEYVKDLFKDTDLQGNYQVNRVDSDIMRIRKSGGEALDNLGKGQIDILIGTQMVAKGLDFPNVTLVGIVSADTALYLKDFRSAERTFQLITQVAGRTGRGEKGGRVILQTVNPTHYSIVYASQHDYHSFANAELEYRKSLFYPPYSHLLRILVEHKNESNINDYCLKVLEKIKNFVAENKGIEILGPAPCPWSRIKNKFRWQIVIKAKNPELIQSLYQTHLKEIVMVGKGIRVTLDMDPLNLL